MGHATTPAPRRARKAHRCDGCGHEIVVGTRHMAWTWFDDGSAGTVRFHAPCYARARDTCRFEDEEWCGYLLCEDSEWDALLYVLRALSECCAVQAGLFEGEPRTIAALARYLTRETGERWSVHPPRYFGTWSRPRHPSYAVRERDGRLVGRHGPRGWASWITRRPRGLGRGITHEIDLPSALAAARWEPAP